VPGSKIKLLVTKQLALVYFPRDTSEQELLEDLYNSVK
jgi:hypothetical protein